MNSIEDLFAPWAIFSNTIMKEIEEKCFEEPIDGGLKKKLIDAGTLAY